MTNKTNSNIEKQLDTQSEKEIALLKLVYDEILELSDGRYALKLNEKIGMQDKNLGISVDTVYNNAIFRNNYVIFKSDNNNYRVIMFNTKIEFNITDEKKIKEIPELEYSLLEIESESNSAVIDIYNTNTGEVITSYNKNSTKNWRPYNNIIILAILNKEKKDIVAVDDEFKCGTVAELLSTRYSSVEKKIGVHGGFKCVTDTGETIELNKYGQLY